MSIDLYRQIATSLTIYRNCHQQIVDLTASGRYDPAGNDDHMALRMERDMQARIICNFLIAESEGR